MLSMFPLLTDEPSGEETQVPDLGDQVDVAVEKTVDFLGIGLRVAVGAALGLLIAILLLGLFRALGRRHPVMRPVIVSMRSPFRVFLIVIGAWFGFVVATPPNLWGLQPGWRDGIFHAFLVLAIIAGTWVLASLIVGIESSIISHVKATGTKRAKRVETQSQIVRRVLVMVVWIVGIAGVLITFPSARAAGASILASAGLFSVIAGLAAQSTLGNVFAGLQVAFSDSLRVDDIVVYEGSYSVVEEITLTYVVLKVWDGRRIIVPSSKLTAETFENWTRRAPELMDSVRIDVDWQVPIDAMRSEYMRCLESTDLWDRRAGVLQVFDAEGGTIKINMLLSTANASNMFDLKYYVREHMVKWIQSSVPRAIPYQRMFTVSFDEYRGWVDQYPDPETFIDKPDTEGEADSPPPTVSDLDKTVVLSAEDLPPNRVPVSQRPDDGESANTDDQPTGVTTTGHESALFSGTEAGRKLSEEFSGPEQAAYDEREKRANRQRALPGDMDGRDVDDGEE